jgi:hypothetical protein
MCLAFLVGPLQWAPAAISKLQASIDSVNRSFFDALTREEDELRSEGNCERTSLASKL